MTRIVTYNVHRCLGSDRRIDVGRIADVIAQTAPDIVALQEVDVGRARTGGVDQAHRIAERLGMAFHFHAALKVEEELYGDALLTTLPERLVKAAALPGYPRIPQLEPRGALWVSLKVGKARLQVINTHLGLVPREQQIQAEALTGPVWLGHADRKDPLILIGDFNATRRTVVHRRLSEHLTESRRALGQRRGTPTFPAAMPVIAIDHVFVSAGVTVRAASVHASALARVASDHLPLVVDFDLADQV